MPLDEAFSQTRDPFSAIHGMCAFTVWKTSVARTFPDYSLQPHASASGKRPTLWTPPSRITCTGGESSSVADTIRSGTEAGSNFYA
jgi:hypothetical protein